MLLSALLALPLAAPFAPPVEIDFAKVAAKFCADRKIEVTQPDALELERVFDEHFVRARLGIFDVRFPVSELKDHAADLKDCAEALLRAQGAWLDWVGPAGLEQAALRADKDVLLAWVKSWSKPQLTTLDKHKERDLYACLQASEAQRAAAQRFSDVLSRGAELGPAAEAPKRVRVFLAPTRRNFAEFVFFLGWVRQDQRSQFWVDKVGDWTQAFLDDDQVMALEYADAGRNRDDYWLGSAMNERDPDVMQQQVVQLAMNQFFATHYGERAPGAFIGGLSMNLVVHIYKLVNTRADGDTRSRRTEARDVFIPGGASSGGVLPKNSAETRFRELHGADYFISILRNVQKEGEALGRSIKNKARCFAIRHDSGGKPILLTAPFLGAAAAKRDPPAKEYNGDFLEFTRAYKCGFIHWLQVAGAGDEKASRKAFAELLGKLADPNAIGEFESVFKEIYVGRTIANDEADKESLEGQFLLWLAKQRGK